MKVSVAYGKEENNISIENENPEMFWITYDYFISWILKNHVLETIFINSVHPELIRRSFDVVSMLAKEDKIDKAYLEIIWNNAQDSHEETVRATLELIQKITLNLNMNCLQFMFKKVNEIPNDEYDEMLISFLKEYTVNAMMNYVTRDREGYGNIFHDAYRWLQAKKNNMERLKYFNLDKFWTIANDSLVIKTNIKEIAVKSLIEILDSPQ